MGTSTWHRSPETEAWQRVRELYAQPDPSPVEVASRIVSALEPETRTAMSDAAVVTCLGTLVEGAQLVEREGLSMVLAGLGVGTEPAAVQIAAGLRGRAEQLIAEQGVASRFGDLALDVTATSAFAVAAATSTGVGIMELPLSVVADSFSLYGRDSQVDKLASLFVGHDLDGAFRYFVARDVPDFIGDRGLPTVAEASQLEDAVAAHCRETWQQVDLSEYGERLARTVDLSPGERVQTLSPVMSAGIAQGLELLGAGEA